MGSLLNWWASVSGIIVVLALLFYWKFVSKLNYWKNKGVFYLPASPVFGNIKDAILMRRSEAEVLKDLYDQLEGKPYCGIFRLNMPSLLICDPELIKSILVKDFGHFTDRGFTVDEKKNPLGAHLFSMSGQRWRSLRIKLSPTFTSGKMKLMFPIIVECAEQMLEKLEKPACKNEAIEMKEVIAQLTTDIIGSCAFGLQLNSIKDSESEFRKYFREALNPSLGARLLFMLGMFVPPLIPFLKRFIGKNVESFFIGAVRDMVKYREENNIDRNDFLQLLIELKNKGKVENDRLAQEDEFLSQKEMNDTSRNEEKIGDIVFTDELLAAQCFVFFIAGFETSSAAASFCLHELAVHPDIQERLTQEVDKCIKDHDGHITYESIQKMKYLDQVLNETLRKYPPLPRLDRVCERPYKIPDTNIILEKGTKVVIPTYALHHDIKYYADPDRFDPERFSDENRNSRHQYVFLPFGEGPRICIGMRFGIMQTKMAIASLLTRYKFTVSNKTTIPLAIDPKGLLMSAKSGIWLQISKRRL